MKKIVIAATISIALLFTAPGVMAQSPYSSDGSASGAGYAISYSADSNYDAATGNGGYQNSVAYTATYVGTSTTDASSDGSSATVESTNTTVNGNTVAGAQAQEIYLYDSDNTRTVIATEKNSATTNVTVQGTADLELIAINGSAATLMALTAAGIIDITHSAFNTDDFTGDDNRADGSFAAAAVVDYSSEALADTNFAGVGQGYGLGVLAVSDVTASNADGDVGVAAMAAVLGGGFTQSGIAVADGVAVGQELDAGFGVIGLVGAESAEGYTAVVAVTADAVDDLDQEAVAGGAFAAAGQTMAEALGVTAVGVAIDADGFAAGVNLEAGRVVNAVQLVVAQNSVYSSQGFELAENVLVENFAATNERRVETSTEADLVENYAAESFGSNEPRNPLVDTPFALVQQGDDMAMSQQEYERALNVTSTNTAIGADGNTATQTVAAVVPAAWGPPGEITDYRGVALSGSIVVDVPHPDHAGALPFAAQVNVADYAAVAMDFNFNTGHINVTNDATTGLNGVTSTSGFDAHRANGTYIGGAAAASGDFSFNGFGVALNNIPTEGAITAQAAVGNAFFGTVNSAAEAGAGFTQGADATLTFWGTGGANVNGAFASAAGAINVDGFGAAGAGVVGYGFSANAAATATANYGPIAIIDGGVTATQPPAFGIGGIAAGAGVIGFGDINLLGGSGATTF
jgi:hypothetical protein